MDTNYSPNPELTEVINWLRNNNYPPLPVAPAQNPKQYHKVVNTDNPAKKTWTHCPLNDKVEPIPLYTGKNPSYLDKNGNPHLVNHSQYQKRLPSVGELKQWFANPSNGIGTLGGWNNTIWLDFDTKHFDSKSAYENAIASILENHPQLQETWLERTQSNGWRIGIRVQELPKFTNFALEPSGKHVGEALGAGRFTVLAPTIGPSLNPYRSINRALPVEIESLEVIGIYPCSSPKKQQPLLPKQPKPTSEATPGTIALEMLCSKFSRSVLRGDNPCGDRSESLVTALADWYGWENYCNQYFINYSGDAESLAHSAGALLGLDANRINRIVKTVNKTTCTPAVYRKDGDCGCWQKIYRLDPATYIAKCPLNIKEQLAALWQQQKASSNSQGKQKRETTALNELLKGSSVQNFNQDNHWSAPVSYKGEIGEWKEKKVQKMYVNAATGESELALDKNNNPVMEKICEFVPFCDFDFIIERELAGDPGGYVLLVKRSTDGLQKRVVVTSDDCRLASSFEQAIEKGLGVDVSCNLSTHQLKALLRERRLGYRYREGKTYQLADRVGQQENGIWVFKDSQFLPDGTPTTEESTGICWNSNLGVSEQGSDVIKSPVIAPSDPEALPRLVAVMRQFFGSNFLPAFFILGYCAAAAHFQTIIKTEGRFPILNTYGPPGGGKTIAVKCGLSLFGYEWSSGAMVGDISPSALWEKGKLCGSLPICLDDPSDKVYNDLEQWIRSWYNATPRRRRWNVQQPHCALIVDANKACGEKLPATLSRLIRLWMPVTKDSDRSVWNELQEAQKKASGAFTSIINLGYPQQEVNELTAELIQYLSLAHERIASSLALIGVYTMKMATLAGIDPDEVKRYLMDVLCPNANDEESSQDALTHFLGIMATAQAENLLGGWNLRRCDDERGNYRSIAIEVGAFDLLDKHFKLPYSKKVIKTLIEQAGGKTRSTQSFDESKDLSQAYARALMLRQPEQKSNDENQLPMPVLRKEKRRCWEIPYNVAAEYIQFDSLHPLTIPSLEELEEFKSFDGLETRSINEYEAASSDENSFSTSDYSFVAIDELDISTVLEYEQQDVDCLDTQSQGKTSPIEHSRNAEELRNKCLKLQAEHTKQAVQLRIDERNSTFNQLQTLLTNYSTLEAMVKVKKDLPAENFISLFIPLKNLVRHWGIETIGTVWEQVPYNPQLHESDEENITVGELVFVRFVGYKDGDNILCPAKVSRTSPSI